MKILDIGCGTGQHTLLLADQFPNARITAIDNNDSYLRKLKERLQVKGLEKRVDVLNLSMFEMDFPKGTFDMIWAEGSIYIAGFQKGLQDWRKFLKKDGYLVCSEISWLHSHPSEESRQFWNQSYSDMNTIPDKIKQIEDNHYVYMSSFVLPKEDWTEEYYAPLAANLKHMREKYAGNEEALEAVEMIQQEINLYHEQSSDYSYVFYCKQRKD